MTQPRPVRDDGIKIVWKRWMTLAMLALFFHIASYLAFASSPNVACKGEIDGH
jgi:hypothetical protein